MPTTHIEIEAAQRKWANAILDIGQTYREGGDYRAKAIRMIDALYAFHTNSGQVLFKPTKAAIKAFRSTPQAALSYFVGSDEDFPEDKGFALEPWVAVRFENAGFLLENDLAVAMGNYFFARPDGSEVKAEFSFGYVQDDEGALHICLHHSSLPFGSQICTGMSENSQK